MMAEIFDIVDEKDKVIGRASRKECHDNFLLHRAVHVFIYNSDGLLFVQKRSSKKDVFPDFYEGSLAGHVNTSETYKTAAVRELKEELGIKAKPAQLKKLGKLRLKVTPENEFVTTFVLKNYDGVITFDRKEVADGRFMDAEEVKNLMKNENVTPAFKKALKQL